MLTLRFILHFHDIFKSLFHLIERAESIKTMENKEENGGNVEAKTENENENEKDSKFITLKVKGTENAVAYKVKKHTKFSKLMDSYCAKAHIDKNIVRFLYDGERISADQTPKDLEMQDGDVIDVHMQQDAGS